MRNEQKAQTVQIILHPLGVKKFMKHDYDKIITRLTIILSKLYQGQKLQPKDLSEEFGVSLRT
ncbi:MAG: hypothetical protein NTW78_03070, partial [Campylobacterales bacterium]|nr:hypothetical protein [Campylobacterales bacterium]